MLINILPSMKYKVDLEKHNLKSMYRIATISKYFLNNPSYKINSQYPTIIQAVRAKQICLQQPVQHSSIQPKKRNPFVSTKTHMYLLLKL